MTIDKIIQSRSQKLRRKSFQLNGKPYAISVLELTVKIRNYVINYSKQQQLPTKLPNDF